MVEDHAIATITNEFIDCHGLKNGKVYDIFITNAGCGYTVAPGISLKTPDGQSGSGAEATAGINTTGSIDGHDYFWWRRLC